VLYVAATRGRDSNKLYVDTAYEPDADTAHEPTPTREAADVLRQVLAAPGADVSATETVANEWADQHNISRIWSEYQTLAATALHNRYLDLITKRSGLTAEQADSVRGSASFGALLAALGKAESRGLDVTTAIPRLVEARTLDGADDVAAVLHERVDRMMHTAPARRHVVPHRIVGLFPQVLATTDLNLERALQERQARIEQRTRALSERAVRNREPWAVQLGRPPSDPVRRERWFCHIDAIAAYRERWNITGRDLFGPEATGSLEQEHQKALAQRAVEAAFQIHRMGLQQVAQPSRSADRSLHRFGPEL